MAMKNASSFAMSGSFQPDAYPFYYSTRTTLVSSMSDETLCVLAPVAGYWVLSAIFHLMDVSNWRALDKYRIHESEEMKKKNLVTPWEVLKAVIFQQIIQTMLGMVFTDAPQTPLPLREHLMKIESIQLAITRYLPWVLGEQTTATLMGLMGTKISWYMYWWGIPALQLFVAMFFFDTWQYGWHRWMHVNKFMYKHFHSVHHRLYVPYAYGALYNHPVEGFILDSLGAVLAQTFAQTSTRQMGLFYLLSSMKTVDDHCGYKIPWDPFQFFASNNADYHDMHHQTIGIKSNFSQPWFVHWDTILGTRMTREQFEQRKKDAKQKTL